MASDTFPAGTHLLTVVVRSSVRFDEALVLPLEVEVVPAPRVALRSEPLVRSGRHKARFRILCANTGNVPLDVSLAATDPERVVVSRFSPATLALPPGRTSVAGMAVRARRHFLGGDVARALTIVGTAGPIEVDTRASFRHQPVIPRGVRTVIILGAIIALWAAVFVVAIDKALTKDKLAKDVPPSFYASASTPARTQSALGAGGRLLFQEAAADQTPAGAVPKSGVVIGVGGTINGTVTAVSTGAGIGRITVEAVEDTEKGPQLISSAATGTDGAYSLVGLLPGPYKLLFTAHGYKDVWYPTAPDEGSASAVNVDAQGTTSGIDTSIAGLPGSISGHVDTGQTPQVPVTVTVLPGQGSTTPIATVTTDPTGAYLVPDLPAPGSYDLSFQAAGYQVASDTEDVAGGEARIASTITLSAGPGTLSGTVTDGTNPLGGVTISANSEGQSITSATPTSGAIGQFTITNVATPATYLLTFTKAGFGTVTIAERLGPGQQLTGIAVAMAGGAGLVSGTVTSPTGQPLGGVDVTVAGGQAPVETQTLTAGRRGVLRTVRSGHPRHVHPDVLSGRLREPDGRRHPGLQRLGQRHQCHPAAAVRHHQRNGSRADGAPHRGGGVDDQRDTARALHRLVLQPARRLLHHRTGARPLVGHLLPHRICQPDCARRPAARPVGQRARHLESLELTVRVDVHPRRLSAIPGEPAVVTISVANTAAVITGHRIRVLGVDPQWARLDTEELSLFPDTTGVARLELTFPRGIPAGPRALSVEITELTPPFDVMAIPITVTVPVEQGIKASLDPVSVTGGRNVSVGVVVENTGNATTDIELAGTDDEGAIRFGFTPACPSVAPGEQSVATAHLRARRPWFGNPKVRPFSVEAGPPGAPVIAFGAWVQRARLSRGAMALVGLVVAATVFAAVITASLAQVVNKSTADRNLAIQVAQAGQSSSANAGHSGIAGTVRLLTSGAPVQGVSVDLFQASNAAQPIVSTATGATGGYNFAGVAAGAYKLQFQGGGFAQLWYPDSLTPDAASAVTVPAGQTVSGIDIRLGGLPGSVSGKVMGGDPSGATLTVEAPNPGAATGAAATTAAALSQLGVLNAVPAAGGAAGAPGTTAIVTTQTLDASGNFDLSNLPSPATYLLVITKQGYAPASQQIDLSGGEVRGGINITLHKGDGSVAGTVSSSGGPLGGATISASDGTTTVNTISLTDPASVGQFEIDNLPTPDTLTLVVSAPGFATQTLSVSLSGGQHVTGVSVTLTSGVGSISGTVSTLAGGPAGGVTVSATDGKVTVTTVSLSVGQVGSYTLAGLPVPDTFTLTFSRSDLASQTQAITLTATGQSNLTGIDASLVSQTGAVFGTVKQQDGQALGEVAVLLSSGSTSYQVVSATVPTLGAYEIDNVTPGTYTISFTRRGGQPTSSILTVVAGQRLPFNPVLNPAASISGTVVNSANAATRLPVPGAQVTLFLATQFPTVSVTSVVTDSHGNFTFANVDAPQSFVVAFAYPQGSAPQETVLVNTTLGTASDVCGSQATGGFTAPTVAPGATCNPATDPIVINTGGSTG